MYYIGIDIGGTSIKCGVLNGKYEIIFKNSVKTPISDNYMVIVNTLTDLINSSLIKTNLSINEIKHIGIGIPGLVDEDGNCQRIVNIGLNFLPLKTELSKIYPNIPIYIENDALIACLAEFKKGALQNSKNGILITLGTGIGGSFVVNSKLYLGTKNANPEIGHMVIGENFYNCACGKNGCFETFCSATGLIEYTKYIIKNNPKINTVLNVNELNAKLILDAYITNDLIAQMAIEYFIKYLSLGISNLINIFNPDTIAIGGGLSASFEIYKDKLTKQINNDIFLKNYTNTKIIKAHFENDAGIIGASLLNYL